ncbi:sugar ABC transporter substrate-binding protein [Tessaracoccus sp. OS52]|uniref:sugar ABC transporter substrate-binding protein n=1 Tax=Tessaracoccus sp. OS52 TaxID=2886691 RepID=UPI001D10C2C2|nr:sugar ABC transporter substrate-binding protein [Tessaracoccus sp. OS52]MCC2594685.1 sugar ABC transporter substrate-binding protein [Tessaracoccus sp. OS52]
MKNSKRALVALTAVLSLISLAACGREETPESPDGESDVETTPISEGPATGSLEVWAMGAEGEKLPELVELFKADNPDVDINVTPVPWDSAHDKFTASIAAGTTPDVAQVGTTWMGEFVGLDALDPTPDLIDGGKFFEGAQQTTVVDGVSYAVPWYVETRLVYYRTDLAEQAGITDTPTDWDGLKEMAAKMQEAGAKWGIALQPGGTGSWQTVLPLMWSNGGQITNEDGTEFTFESEQNAEALAYYQSFFTEGIANDAPTEGTTESDFVSGDVPMFISGPWMMAAVEDVGGEGFADKYDVMTMPEAEMSASFIGGSNLGVFKSTDNRDAAWKFVDFLTQEETQVEWFKISTDLPSVQSAWDSDELSADEKLAKFGTQLETAYAPPSIPTWEQIADTFDSQVEQVTKTGADPAEALAAVQQEATSIGMG